MMHVGTLLFQIGIDGAQSLKDKRQVVRSLIDNLKHRFGVSAAEVDDLDLWNRATIGVALVSNSRRVANSALDKIVDFVESDPRLDLVHFEIELL